jgi:hypothetical protein
MIPDTFTMCVLPFGVKNKNGRIYTRESIKSIPEHLMVAIGEPKESLTTDIRNVCAAVDNVDIREDGIYITAHKTNTPARKLMDIYDQAMGLEFVTCGVGSFDNEHVVMDYQLLRIDAIPKGSSAW